MRRKAFTLLELLVVISIIALLVGILLPALASARLTARKMQNSSQLRGIHQQMVVFAQDNKNFFPGLTPTGVVNGLAGQGRLRDATFGMLERGDYYEAPYLVSPGEVDPSINGESPRNGPTTSYGSFAVLEYATGPALSSPTDLGRLEWKESLQTTAVVLSDRAINLTAARPQSIWMSVNGQWSGTVLFNDNHAQFELSDKGFIGSYGKTLGAQGTGSINNLFDLEGGNGRMTSSN